MSIPSPYNGNALNFLESLKKSFLKSHLAQLLLITLLILGSRSLSAQVREGQITSAEVFTKQGFIKGCDNSIKVITFTAYITADGPCEATYRWTRNDGALGREQTLIFKEAGTQILTTTWTLSHAAYSGWEKVQFSKPNTFSSNQAAFEIYCCEKETVNNCKINPFTMTICAQSMLGSFKNLVKGIDTNICNTTYGISTTTSAMYASCYTPSANLSGLVSYAAFYVKSDTAFRISWSSTNLGYDYYGACRPNPILWPVGMPENHVYGALLVPIDAYKASPYKDNYLLIKQDALRPEDIADLLGWYLEPSTGYIATTEPVRYNDRLSSKGTVVKVRLKTGEDILCYVLNNYDTGGTMYWKDECVGDDGVITKITTQPKIETTDGQGLIQISPNPFTVDTEIKMNIPTTAKQATLSIYNLAGVTVKQVSIAERGTFSYKLSATGLKSGLYICSLNVDGKVNTQKMIVGQ